MLQTIRNLGAIRLAAMVAVLAATIGFFVFLTTRITTPGYGLLFSDLDLHDSGEIVQKLDAANVPYQLHADGAEILVPMDQVTRLRMQMAEAGIPHGGSVGYEIFDKSDTFGTSRFVENINQVRALEGELERTITSIALIQSARVHIVLPTRELFSRDRTVPSASIVVKLRGVGQLDKNQIAAIQHLVAAAVPGLNPNRVALVDSDGNLLASGDGNTATALTATSSEETRINYENHLAHSVEELLARSVGPGKARVDVHADMDFDRVTTNSETYNPDGQVVRSTQTSTQSDDSGSGGNSDQPVSVSSNQPNGSTSTTANATRSKSAHNDETVNYEISKTVRNQISDTGTVRRLSVAVLVDGTTTVGADGKKTYQPRSADDLKQLTALVRSAVGYDQKRGDVVDVVNLPFAGIEEPAAAPPPWSMMGLEKPDLIRIGETGALALLGLAFILLVVRPLINRVFESAAAANAASAANELLPAPGGAGPAALPAPGAGNALARTTQPGSNDMIDIGQVDGRVAASAIRKVGEIVDKHPEEAVSIVRSWMYQGS